jgi:hypothetical protein
MSGKFKRGSERLSVDCDILQRGNGRQMAGSLTFWPQGLADALNYATQVDDLISDSRFTPSSVGLTSEDATDSGTKLAAVGKRRNFFKNPAS